MNKFSSVLLSSSNAVKIIFKLNYETFVDEIPQHEKNETKKLKDKFHDKNIYIIAKKENEVIGMISLSDTRPFSLDDKLNNIDTYYKGEYRKPVEIRLLSIKHQYRKTKVFTELIQRTFNYIIQNSYDIVFISGTVRQEKLYKHIGFVQFHENVGTKDAEYMPMYLDLTAENKIINRLAAAQRINFLPGPVDLSDDVVGKLSKKLYSHRSNEFVTLTKDTLAKLERILDVKCTTILHGSATLANEAIMAQLKGRGLSNGLVLANGEFGNRLIRESKRHGLNIDDYSVMEVKLSGFDKKWYDIIFELDNDYYENWNSYSSYNSSIKRLYNPDIKGMKEKYGKFYYNIILSRIPYGYDIEFLNKLEWTDYKDFLKGKIDIEKNPSAFANRVRYVGYILQDTLMSESDLIEQLEEIMAINKKNPKVPINLCDRWLERLKSGVKVKEL